MSSKREFALRMVQDTLTEAGVSSEAIEDITEAITGAFDDERREALREAETLLIGALDQMR